MIQLMNSLHMLIELKDAFGDASGIYQESIFNFCYDAFLNNSSKMPKMDEYFISGILTKTLKMTNNLIVFILKKQNQQEI